MARAKRTDRAAARRRYRATFVEAELEGDLDGDDRPTSATVERSAVTARSGGSNSGAPRPQRPSIIGAFRSSFRPLDIRGDLLALPMLLRHPAFLVPTVLSGLSVALIPLVGLNALTSMFFQYFSFTAPLGTSFIAGFFAPRASYLVGILAALASVGFQALAFNVGQFGGLLEGFKDAAGNPMTQDGAAALVLSQAIFVGVPSAAFFASAAAWYRRFLRRATPPRPQASGGPARRDGKQVKRNTERPMLARRR